jgi:hypothetical protein
MSEENVEILRASFQALNRGDLDAATALAPPISKLTCRERWAWCMAPTPTISGERCCKSSSTRGSRLRDRAVTRLALHQEREEALKAAGLSQ